MYTYMNVYVCTLTFTPMMQAKKKGEIKKLPCNEQIKEDWILSLSSQSHLSMKMYVAFVAFIWCSHTVYPGKNAYNYVLIFDKKNTMY